MGQDETFSADADGFEQVYRRHVDYVVAQNMDAVLADMAPGSVPAVFAGVDTPRSAILGTEIRRADVDGGLGVGECVYTTEDAVIGLRSGWAHDGATWKADSLENFEA